MRRAAGVKLGKLGVAGLVIAAVAAATTVGRGLWQPAAAGAVAAATAARGGEDGRRTEPAPAATPTAVAVVDRGPWVPMVGGTTGGEAKTAR